MHVQHQAKVFTGSQLTISLGDQSDIQYIFVHNSGARCSWICGYKIIIKKNPLKKRNPDDYMGKWRSSNIWNQILVLYIGSTFKRTWSAVKKEVKVFPHTLFLYISGESFVKKKRRRKEKENNIHFTNKIYLGGINSSYKIFLK